MNDRPATAASPEPPESAAPTPREAELGRRLADLAATTTIAPDAWEAIQRRLTAGEVVVPATVRSGPRPRPRLLLAVAAAVAMVVAVAAVVVAGRGGDDDGGEVETVDDATTTTERDGPNTTDGGPIASTPPSRPPLGGSAGAPGPSGDDEGPSPDGSAPPPAVGAGEPTGTGAAPGGTPTTAGPSPSPTVALRSTPAATVVTADYTFEAVFDDDERAAGDPQATVALYVRRADDVGSTGNAPDGFGSFAGSWWGRDGGDPLQLPCLYASLVAVDTAGTPAHDFVYGLVGPEVASVEVVLTDGTHIPAPVGTGPGPPGYDARAWVVERPPVEVDHVAGFDAAGGEVAAATFPPGKDAASAICQITGR